MRFSLNPKLNPKVLAGLVGAAVVGALGIVGGVVIPVLLQVSVTSVPAVAQVFQAAPGKALDTHLARFDGNYYAVATEPDVSMTPLSTTVVRKIGYGETSFVTVTTTSSGVYSSDGLASPNVQYPGIHVEPLQLEPDPFGGQNSPGWSKLTGWTRIPLLSADSFGFLDDTAVPASAAGVCVKSARTGACV